MAAVKSYEDVKNLEDIKHINAITHIDAIKHIGDIKGLKDIKTMEDIEGREDHRGLFQVQAGIQEKAEMLRQNVLAAQARLQTGITTAHETLEENAQQLRENVEQVGNLPETIKKALIHKAVEVGVRQIKKSVKRRIKHAATMPLEATKSGLESVEGAVEKLVEIGESATQKVLGKSAGKNGKDLKKTPEKTKSLPGSLGKRLQNDFGLLREETKKQFKKD